MCYEDLQFRYGKKCTGILKIYVRGFLTIFYQLKILVDFNSLISNGTYHFLLDFYMLHQILTLF